MAPWSAKGYQSQTYGNGGKGQQNYVPGWDPSWDYQDQGKGHGKGKGSKNKGKGGKPADETLDKLMAKIDKLEANQKKLLQKGQTTLADAKALTSAQNADQLICPKCGCAHDNLNKYKCRVKTCKAILRPDALPLASAPRRPKDPLSSNYYQSFFARLGAMELLEESQEAQVQVEDSNKVAEEAVAMAVDTEGEEEHRNAQLQILQHLKSVGASSAVIKSQQMVIDGLPKPKPQKPLQDAGRLWNALSVATEHYQTIAAKDSDLVNQCELAIQKAQEALNHARKLQQENQMMADKKLKAIRVQIQKTQETNKDELEVPQAARVEDNPDFALVKNDFLDTINKSQLPPHLVTFLENVEIVPKMMKVSAQATPKAATEDAAQDPRAAAWEAA